MAVLIYLEWEVLPFTLHSAWMQWRALYHIVLPTKQYSVDYADSLYQKIQEEAQSNRWIRYEPGREAWFAVLLRVVRNQVPPRTWRDSELHTRWLVNFTLFPLLHLFSWPNHHVTIFKACYTHIMLIMKLCTLCSAAFYWWVTAVLD